MVSLLPEETKPFERILETFATRRILVVGDLMLDRFNYGSVGRISPEAPAAVIHLDELEETIGGAGNVARNIASLGGHCDLIAGIGHDEAAQTLSHLIGILPGVTAHFVHLNGRPTTVKGRFVARLHNTHLLRADIEDARPIATEIEDDLIERAQQLVGKNDAVLLSDYGKGLLTPRVITEIVRFAKDCGRPVVVDPKGSHYVRYRGASYITPNLSELRQAAALNLDDEESQIQAAATLSADLDCKGILVTRGDKGVLLTNGLRECHRYPATARRVIDVSGAGDTLVAAFALSLVSGGTAENSARLANIAAGIVVGKPGTANVEHQELRDALLSRPKLELDAKIFHSRLDLENRVSAWRNDGLVVGFTNGCFDILHEGHIQLLAEARSYCDRLIVALNSDASVKRLKGPSRPVQREGARTRVMAALSVVDAVVCFDEDTPLELINQVVPNVLVKGADYLADQVVGKSIVEKHGGRVILISLVENSSTTGIVKRMRTSKAATADTIETHVS
ncbi:D-glycero-beta-D-manno-heptose 1-phosphate adenylyltransferase [Bradyrhizobium sp. USDA 3650]